MEVSLPRVFPPQPPQQMRQLVLPVLTSILLPFEHKIFCIYISILLYISLLVSRRTASSTIRFMDTLLMQAFMILYIS